MFCTFYQQRILHNALSDHLTHLRRTVSQASWLDMADDTDFTIGEQPGTCHRHCMQQAVDVQHMC